MTRLSALLAFLTFLILPAAAQASVAGLDPLEGETVVYAADPGEANRLTITGEAKKTIVFQDPAATITAGRGCTSVNAHRVTCTSTTTSEDGAFVLASLEDGDDEATTKGELGFVSLDGGSGNDRLDGSVGKSGLDGGIGTDQLIGGPATGRIDAVDTVRSAGIEVMPVHRVERDEVSCAAPAGGGSAPTIQVDTADVVSGPCGQRQVFMKDWVQVDGTAGNDRLDSSFLPSHVNGLEGDDFIELFGQHGRADGGPGNDTIQGSGLLLGGPGDDKLDAQKTSTVAARLDGEDGDDQLLGSAAGDRFTGGAGRDTITARSGNDTIRVRDGERDTVNCGDGRDVVLADRLDVLKSCERIGRASVSSAGSRSSGCAIARAKGSHVIVKSKEAVLYTRGFYHYGCLASTGRPVRLLDEGGGFTEAGEAGPKLAGRYVAYITQGSAIGDEFDRVYVYDLKVGRQFFFWSSNFVQDLELKRNGSVAWIQASIANFPGDTFGYEVRKFGNEENEGTVLVDRGTDIDRHSLTLTADRNGIAWTRGGTARTAPLH